MPYRSKEINPVKYSENHTSQNSQYYKGFSTVDPTSSDSRLYDFDLIRQDILNQFNVRKNERVMNPDFGTIIWDRLFDPFTDAVRQEIAEDVQRIVTSDPRANAIDVNVIDQEYGMLLEITLLYVGTDQTQSMKLNFDKSAGLSEV